jgi:CDP-paratose 2-epimerase
MINLYFSSLSQIDKLSGKAFNVGGGMKNSLSLIELFEIIENELGIEMLYKKLPFRESDQKIFVADYSKIKNLTGWAPKVNKIDGIKKMITWLQDL